MNYPFMMLAVLFLLGCETGCGRWYYLPGHNENNLKAPPDITMHVGERKQIFWTGPTLWYMCPSNMSIAQETPGVVALSFPDVGEAYIQALAPGVARLHYYPIAVEDLSPDNGNKGFAVTVLPKDR
jgi:hypothetical protein